MTAERVTALAAVALLATSCATLRLGDQSVASPRQAELALRWHRPLSEPSQLDWASQLRGGVAMHARLGLLLVGGVDRRIRALRASDGALVWQFDALGRVDSTPTIVNDLAYFGAGDGAIYAIDVATGTLRWRTVVGAEVVHSPSVSGNSVTVVTGADAVVSLDLTTGERRWTYRRPPPGGISATGHAGLRIVDTRLYTGFADGAVVCLDVTDGSVLWEVDTAAELDAAEDANEGHQAIDVDTTPVVINDTVFVASQAVGVLALDTLSGSRRWGVASLTRVTALCADDRALFVHSSERGLMRIDPFDGHVLWSRDTGARAVLQIQSLGNHRLLLGSMDQGLTVVSNEGGEVLDALRTGRGVAAPVLSTATRIYVHSNGDVLYALDRTQL